MQSLEHLITQVCKSHFTQEELKLAEKELIQFYTTPEEY